MTAKKMYFDVQTLSYDRASGCRANEVRVKGENGMYCRNKPGRGEKKRKRKKSHSTAKNLLKVGLLLGGGALLADRIGTIGAQAYLRAKNREA